MRIAALLVFAMSLSAADNLNPDALYGHWVVDEKAATKDQKADVSAAAQVENFGITLTLRTARVIFAKDEVVAGMWRLDEATPSAATLVIQPKGADEHRYHVTVEKGHLVIAECPGKLPLKNAR